MSAGAKDRHRDICIQREALWMPFKDSAETLFCDQEKCRAGNQQIKLVYWDVGLTNKEENESMGLS